MHIHHYIPTVMLTLTYDSYILYFDRLSLVDNNLHLSDIRGFTLSNKAKKVKFEKYMIAFGSEILQCSYNYGMSISIPYPIYVSYNLKELIKSLCLDLIKRDKANDWLNEF